MISFFCCRIFSWFSTWLFSPLRVAMACSSSWCCSVAQNVTRMLSKEMFFFSPFLWFSTRDFDVQISWLTFHWLSALFFNEQLCHEAVPFVLHDRQSGLNLVRKHFPRKGYRLPRNVNICLPTQEMQLCGGVSHPRNVHHLLDPVLDKCLLVWKGRGKLLRAKANDQEVFLFINPVVLIFKRHQSDSFEESRSCFPPPPRPDSNMQLLTCFLPSLMCNRDKLTKRQLPIGNQLGVLLRVARIKVCQKLRQHLKNHQRVKYAQHKLVNAKILSIRLKPRTHLHIVIFEHHWVFKLLQGLLIDFNLIVEFLVLVLPAFNSYLMLKRKSTLSIFYFNS